LRDFRVEIRIPLRERKRLAAEAQHVGDHEHLSVDVPSGTDTDGRDIDRPGNGLPGLLCDCLEDDCEYTGRFQSLSGFDERVDGRRTQ